MRGLIDFNHKVHAYFAVMLWVLFFTSGTILNPVTLLVGSLLPDADIRFSPAGRILPLWLIFKHRTWLHTVWALLAVSLIVWELWNLKAGVSMAVGYFSHLFLDSCTPSGLGWLKPKRLYRKHR